MLLNLQWQNCSIFKNFYTDGGLNMMKPISPLLIEVAFKQYQEHGGGPHQGDPSCSTKSAVGVLIEEVALHQYQECSGVLIEEVALHQYQECSGVLIEEVALHQYQECSSCSWRRGLSISSVPRVWQGAHAGGDFPFPQYQECGRVLMEERAFHQYQECGGGAVVWEISM